MINWSPTRTDLKATDTSVWADVRCEGAPDPDHIKCMLNALVFPRLAARLRKSQASKSD